MASSSSLLSTSQTGSSSSSSYSMGKYKRCFFFPFQDAQSITSFDAINAFYDPHLVVSTSDRRIHLCDASQEVVLHSIDASRHHQRVVHRIIMPSPQPSMNLDASSYKIFASMAADGFVKLWDMRALNRPALALSGHEHRREQLISGSFSPCLRFLSVGSEDGKACLFDLRQASSSLHRLTPGSRDTVSSVKFNPASSQIITGSFSGEIKFYGF